MRQERWASHEKQRERRQTDVRHRIGATVLRSVALVRKTSAHLSQFRYQALECAHPSVESCAEPMRKLKPLDLVHVQPKPTQCGKSDSPAVRPPRPPASKRHITLECDSSALRTAGSPPVSSTLARGRVKFLCVVPLFAR